MDTETTDPLDDYTLWWFPWAKHHYLIADPDGVLYRVPIERGGWAKRQEVLPSPAPLYSAAITSLAERQLVLWHLGLPGTAVPTQGDLLWAMREIGADCVQLQQEARQICPNSERPTNSPAVLRRMQAGKRLMIR